MKKFKILALVFVVLFVIVEVFVLNKTEEKVNTKPIVSVSSFFLYDITKHIAQDSVEIVNILPFGIDPHSFEMTPRIMAKIERSSLVLFSGAGLEHWISKIKFNCKAVDISKFVKLRELASDEFEFHKYHDKQCAHNTLDSHYWLDFDNMKNATKVVTQQLILLEPKNSLIKQYKRLFEFENVKLIFKDEAVLEIAKKAINKKTGARGLRSILEDVMLDIMYELPEYKDQTVTITKDVVNKTKKPKVAPAVTETT